MPLSIPLPAHAKVIINGAVIENGGPGSITLMVHNQANILRDRDVITQDEATTPAREIYHTIQNAYLFEANRAEWLGLAGTLLGKFLLTHPEAGTIVQHVHDLVTEGKLYNALRASRRLIALESGEPPDAQPEPSPKPQPRSGSSGGQPPRTQEIGRIKSQIAALERRIAALDEH